MLSCGRECPLLSHRHHFLPHLLLLEWLAHQPAYEIWWDGSPKWQCMGSLNKSETCFTSINDLWFTTHDPTGSRAWCLPGELKKGLIQSNCKECQYIFCPYQTHTPPSDYKTPNTPVIYCDIFTVMILTSVLLTPRHQWHLRYSVQTTRLCRNWWCFSFKTTVILKKRLPGTHKGAVISGEMDDLTLPVLSRGNTPTALHFPNTVLQCKEPKAICGWMPVKAAEKADFSQDSFVSTGTLHVIQKTAQAHSNTKHPFPL